MSNGNGQNGQNGQQLTTTAGGAIDPYTAYANSQQSTYIVGKLLKFTKGDYSAGESGIPIPMGTRFVVNMDSMIAGWVRWQDNKPTEQNMEPISRRPIKPPRPSLGEMDPDYWPLDADGKPRDPWQEGNYVLLKIDETAGVMDERFKANDPLAGVYTFAASSKGALAAVAVISKAYGNMRRMGRDDIFPVISLGVDSYQHPNKSYGRIKKPIFEIVEWVSKDAFPPLDEVMEDAIAPAPAPKQVAAPTRAAPDQGRSPAPGKPAPSQQAAPATNKPAAKPRF